MENPSNKTQGKRKERNVKDGNAAAAGSTPRTGRGEKDYQSASEMLPEGEKMKELLAESEHKLKVLRSKADRKKVAQARLVVPVDRNSKDYQRQKTIADLCRDADVQFGMVEKSMWADCVHDNRLQNGEMDVRPLILSFHPDLPGIGAHSDPMNSIDLPLPNESGFDAFEVNSATDGISEVATNADEIDDDWVVVGKV